MSTGAETTAGIGSRVRAKNRPSNTPTTGGAVKGARIVRHTERPRLPVCRSRMVKEIGTMTHSWNTMMGAAAEASPATAARNATPRFPAFV